MVSWTQSLRPSIQHRLQSLRPKNPQQRNIAVRMSSLLVLWDRRQDRMIARLELGHKGTPPWCMSVSSPPFCVFNYQACWSTNGDFIYAGRRNGTVDEYSMHKPTSVPTRTFRFPGNSGQVTSVHAMPNGRNLIWYWTSTCLY